MVLLVDNYGRSANVLAFMVKSLGKEVSVVPDSETRYLEDLGFFESVILSPGTGAGTGDGLSDSIIRGHIQVPVFGMCQWMYRFLQEAGGTVVKSRPVFIEDTLSHTGEGLFTDVPQRFRIVLRQTHTIDRKTIPENFDTDAYSSDGSVQGINCNERKIYGTGFDPSSYRTESGLVILRNFLTMC